jgi:hypothetical protein
MNSEPKLTNDIVATVRHEHTAAFHVVILLRAAAASTAGTCAEREREREREREKEREIERERERERKREREKERGMIQSCNQTQFKFSSHGCNCSFYACLYNQGTSLHACSQYR